MSYSFTKSKKISKKKREGETNSEKLIDVHLVAAHLLSCFEVFYLCVLFFPAGIFSILFLLLVNTVLLRLQNVQVRIARSQQG